MSIIFSFHRVLFWLYVVMLGLATSQDPILSCLPVFIHRCAGDDGRQLIHGLLLARCPPTEMDL